ncbi:MULTISPECIES: carbohydrate ABC transporter permease [unclassified Actinomyces]|uniref:carbohydrate ABC transporter permease n=1 Tax=unclassified Actinomyces TaxID=2609248 RepID=UPI0020180B10|nr:MULTISPECIES: carbohydrate ABC transporter permease [unclassified Actinomyces]MCL3777324.1 carbohydrate ABC transporter permease [Actinomyces sp. AC-20-1]MCL3789652.1 carbohydrate ABC transporter permease [Actinomyces sp. 187325]MCL3792183.1 carbohydrate ABC transporter permease [Actinomyces sp. 186855]MCL3794815.1 carbohydrate ABC transporter permease [Actinomyces sp. 217892]
MSTSTAPVLPRNRRQRDWVLVGLWVALVVVALTWLMPFAVMLLTSVKSGADLASGSTIGLPEEWLWGNYLTAAQVGDLWITGSNSLLVAVIKVPLGLFLATLAAYALARIRMRHHKLLVAFFAVGSMVPIQVALGPMFQLLFKAGMLDTYAGLILPYLAFGVPYQIFMMYGSFRAIPDSLEESARLDGASSLRIYWQICLPLVKPTLAALFVLDFVATWNEYAMASTIIQSDLMSTIPMAVQNFSSQHGTDYGPLNAFIIMTAIPVLLVYLIFQRYFVSGAFTGAVKG